MAKYGNFEKILPGFEPEVESDDANAPDVELPTCVLSARSRRLFKHLLSQLGNE